MYPDLSTIKGIHPGFVIQRELTKRKLRKNQFAQSLHEHPQTIGAVLKAKRNLTTELALKIERELEFEEGYLLVLQTYYNIGQEKSKHHKKPDLKKFRPVLFWDTDFNAIRWEIQKQSVIRRVFERGNEIEKEEIRWFYGENEVDKVIADDE